MIYWQLFWTFFQVGAVSFGGGYGMISLIREKILGFGWLSDGELLNMIAVSESTPGPIAVNMATFVGAKQGGIPGALLATLGIVLPSFLILLIIAALMRNFLKYKGVQGVLSGVRPCVVGLILATAVTMAGNLLFSFRHWGDDPTVDLWGILLFGLIAAGSAVYRRFRKKAPSPILLILISAGLGILFYGVLPPL